MATPTPSSRHHGATPITTTNTSTHTNTSTNPIGSPATAPPSTTTANANANTANLQSIPMGRGFSQRSQRSTPMRPANSQRGGTTTTNNNNNNNNSNAFSAPPPPFPYAPSASLHPRDVSVSGLSGGATPLVAELSTEGMMNMNMNSPSALLALGIGGGISSGGAAAAAPPPAAATTSGAGVSGNVSAAGMMTPLSHSHPHPHPHPHPHHHAIPRGPSMAGILHDNDIPSLSVAPIPDVSVAGTAPVRGGTVGPGGGSGAVDAAEERGRRLNEVLALLRSRITGRGVSREGIVQLSKLEGLECMWQGDNLTVAGSSIDLEIEFESGGSDYVRDVTLSYAVPATGDIVTRKDGAEVLKRNMVLSDDEKREYKWKRLDDFHENIQRLARFDQLSKQVSCSQAIEGLHTSLKEIWNAEEVRGRYNGYYDHVSTNAIGGPNLDKGKRIGLVVDYWVPQRRILDRRRAAENNKMDIDTGNAGEKKQASPLAVNPWSAEIDCEEGFPSLRVSSQWVSPDIYSEPPQPQSSEPPKGDQEQQQQQQTTPQPTIAWLEPPSTTVTPDQPQPNTTAAAAATAPTPAPIPIDRRFVARLTPPIHLPVRIASDIFRTLQIPIPPDLRSSIYDHLVVPPERDSPLTPARKGGKAGTTAAVNVEPTIVGSERKVPRGKPFQKVVYTMGEDEGVQGQGQGEGEGRMVRKRHDYIFHAFEPTMGCTIRNLPFAHPRQLTEIFPMLRQYALLSSLLERVFSPSTTSTSSNEIKTPRDQTPQPQQQQQPFPPSTYISNITPLRTRLNTASGLDSDAYYNTIDPRRKQALNAVDNAKLYTHHHHHYGQDDDEEVPIKRVDVSLRTLVSGPPSIMLLFHAAADDSKGEEVGRLGMVSVNISIGLNGQIDIADVSGPWQDEDEDEDEDVEMGEDGQEEKEEEEEGEDRLTREVREKLKNVLETCEDLSVAIEWMVRWIQQWKREKEKGKGRGVE